MSLEIVSQSWSLLYCGYTIIGSTIVIPLHTEIFTSAQRDLIAKNDILVVAIVSSLIRDTVY